jgi:hypothetical protein
MFQSEEENKEINDSSFSSPYEETPTMTPKNLQFVQKSMQDTEFSLQKLNE